MDCQRNGSPAQRHTTPLSNVHRDLLRQGVCRNRLNPAGPALISLLHDRYLRLKSCCGPNSFDRAHFPEIIRLHRVHDVRFAIPASPPHPSCVYCGNRGGGCNGCQDPSHTWFTAVGARCGRSAARVAGGSVAIFHTRGRDCRRGSCRSVDSARFLRRRVVRMPVLPSSSTGSLPARTGVPPDCT